MHILKAHKNPCWIHNECSRPFSPFWPITGGSIALIWNWTRLALLLRPMKSREIVVGCSLWWYNNSTSDHLRPSVSENGYTPTRKNRSFINTLQSGVKLFYRGWFSPPSLSDASSVFLVKGWNSFCGTTTEHIWPFLSWSTLSHSLLQKWFRWAFLCLWIFFKPPDFLTLEQDRVLLAH